jgi:phenylacetate-CoA ligase
MRRLDRFDGRSDDMMIIRGVNVFPSQIAQPILLIAQLGGQCQIEIHREEAVDHMEMLSFVQAKPAYPQRRSAKSSGNGSKSPSASVQRWI